MGWEIGQKSRQAIAALLFTISFSASYAEDHDKVVAIDALCQQAEQGDANAQVMLGLIYGGELGWPRDDSQALKWLHKAAEQGNAVARGRLRKMFIEGEFVPEIDDQAGDWWLKLAEQANAEAQTFSNLRIAAESGSADAQVNLGVAVLTGVGTGKDRGQATMLFRKAAEQGQAEAGCLLGAINASDSAWDVARDNIQAVDMCRKAANDGYADAQLVLGNLYRNGRGVPKDEVQAAHWYFKAAEQGRSDAQWLLGYMYDTGKGVPKDEAQANVWYRKAADQGNPTALTTLSIQITLARLTGGSGPLEDTVDPKVFSDLGIEHFSDDERDLLRNLWASQVQQDKELNKSKRND